MPHGKGTAGLPAVPLSYGRNDSYTLLYVSDLGAVEEIPIGSARDGLQLLIGKLHTLLTGKGDEVLRRLARTHLVTHLLGNLELAERILAGTDDMIQIQTPDGPTLMASVNHGPDVHGNIVYKVDDPRGF